MQRIIRVCLHVFHVLEPYTIAKAQRLQTFTNGLRPYIFYWGKKIIHIQIAKNRNYIITGRVAVLPLTGKYCMEKRGVAASELSTVRKMPEYHADFVIWGFGT